MIDLPDKQPESDRKMFLRVGKKFAVLFFSLLLFDTFLDWFLQLFDIIIELGHLFIELIEYSIELVLQYIFHTDHQESETIIVNSTFIIAIYGIYLFYRAAPQLFIRIKRNSLAVWLRYKRRKSSYWRSLTLTLKIELVSLYCLGITCLIFLVTL